MLAEGAKPRSADEAGTEIRYNIPLEVGEHDHVEGIAGRPVSCRGHPSSDLRSGASLSGKTLHEQAIGDLHDVGLNGPSGDGAHFLRAISRRNRVTWMLPGRVINRQ